MKVLPYLCGGVVMNDPFALSLIFVVPLLSVYLVIKLIFTYIALSIDNHILLKVNVDAFKYKQKLTKCFLFGFSSDLLSLIITMLVSNFKALDYINMMFFAGGNVEYLLGIVISYFFTFIIFFYFSRLFRDIFNILYNFLSILFSSSNFHIIFILM